MLVRRPTGRKQSLTCEQRMKLQKDSFLFTVEEWADLYKVTPQTIRNMIKNTDPIQLKLQEMREAEIKAIKEKKKKKKLNDNIVLNK